MPIDIVSEQYGRSYRGNVCPRFPRQSDSLIVRWTGTWSSATRCREYISTQAYNALPAFLPFFYGKDEYESCVRTECCIVTTSTGEIRGRKGAGMPAASSRTTCWAVSVGMVFGQNVGPLLSSLPSAIKMKLDFYRLPVTLCVWRPTWSREPRKSGPRSDARLRSTMSIRYDSPGQTGWCW